LTKGLLDLQKIRAIANYQFGKDVGHALFPDEAKIIHSKKTKRVRHIYLEGKLLATLRPTDGMFSLTISGAKRLTSILEKPRLRVVVQEDVEKFIVEGRNVFSRHVVVADQEIRAGEEVIITNKNDDVLAVGKALLTGKEMLVFKRGIAVKVRRGVGEEERRCGE